MRKTTVILLGALLFGLPIEEALARGGRGGGRGGPSAGRSGPSGRNRNSNRRNERTEEQARQRRDQRLARVAFARLEYAKREREATWNAEARARLDAILQRVLGS